MTAMGTVTLATSCRRWRSTPPPNGRSSIVLSVGAHPRPVAPASRMKRASPPEPRDDNLIVSPAPCSDRVGRLTMSGFLSSDRDRQAFPAVPQTLDFPSREGRVVETVDVELIALAGDERLTA